MLLTSAALIRELTSKPNLVYYVVGHLAAGRLTRFDRDVAYNSESANGYPSQVFTCQRRQHLSSRHVVQDIVIFSLGSQPFLKRECQRRLASLPCSWRRLVLVQIYSLTCDSQMPCV